MSIRTIVLASAVVLLSAASAFASGECRSTGEKKPVEAIVKSLEEQGYRDLKIETDDGCYEAKGHNAAGQRVELYVDPVTGEIVKRKGEKS